MILPSLLHVLDVESITESYVVLAADTLLIFLVGSLAH